MEHNDDWQTQNRYMQIEGFAEAGRQARRPQAVADYTQGGLTNDTLSYTRKLHHIDGRDPNTAGRPKYFADVKIRRQDAETVVKLTIEGHPGSWVKMADQPNDAATDGIRPVRDEKIR